MTNSLFYEESKTPSIEPVFTIRDEDRTENGVLYRSLYKLYMEMEDLTEYEFANAYLDGWQHWQKLVEAGFFQPFIQRWRTELELKIKARAMRSIVKEAATEGKHQYEANKYLVAKGWIDKTAEPSRRGRPSKQEVDRKLKEEMFLASDIEEDLKRIQANANDVQ